MATKKKAARNDNGLNIAGRVAAYFIDSKLTLLIVLVAVLAATAILWGVGVGPALTTT